MRTSNCGIYKIVNIIDNKIYIGSSHRLKERKYEHFLNLSKNKHRNTYLQNSFNKYGKENFKWEVLEYIDRVDDRDLLRGKLLKREQYYLNLNYGENCYNLCPTAGSNLGYEFSEKHKEKIRKSHIGLKLSEETKEKIKNGNRGKELSEETKKKISKKRLGHEVSIKTRNKIGKVHLGKTLSDETKNKISLNSKNKKSILNLDTGEVFMSIGEAARKYNLNISSIHHVCKRIRNRKTAGGFRWKYLDE